MTFRRPECHYVWIRRPDGPLGERRYRQVSRLGDRGTAEALRDGLERAGHEVYVRSNDARYPGTGGP